MMDSCFSSNQKLTLAQQQLQADYDKVKNEELEKSHKLQELMSVDPLSKKHHSHDNRYLYETEYPYFKHSKSPLSWEEFIPYRDEISASPKHSSKFSKDAMNHMTKLSKVSCNMSIFHIHTFHLHLFISLTLLLVTHRCPQYLLVI